MAASTVELTLRMVVALAFVGGALLFVTRIARTRLRLNVADTPIDVYGRRQLTKSSAVAVVRAGKRYVLIGVNDHAITLLAEGDDLVDPALEPEVVDVRGKTTRGGAWKRRNGTKGPASSGTGVVNALREKTVRRG